MKAFLLFFIVLASKFSFAESELITATRQAGRIKQKAIASAIACVKYEIACPTTLADSLAIGNLLEREVSAVIGSPDSTQVEREEALVMLDDVTAFRLKLTQLF